MSQQGPTAGKSLAGVKVGEQRGRGGGEYNIAFLSWLFATQGGRAEKRQTAWRSSRQRLEKLLINPGLFRECLDYVYKLSNTFNFSTPTVTFIDFQCLSLRDDCNTSWVAGSRPIAVWPILNRVVNRSSLNQVNHLNLLLGMFQGLPFAFRTTSKFVDMMYKAHKVWPLFTVPYLITPFLLFPPE